MLVPRAQGQPSSRTNKWSMLPPVPRPCPKSQDPAPRMLPTTFPKRRPLHWAAQPSSPMNRGSPDIHPFSPARDASWHSLSTLPGDLWPSWSLQLTSLPTSGGNGEVCRPPTRGARALLSAGNSPPERPSFVRIACLCLGPSKAQPSRTLPRCTALCSAPSKQPRWGRGFISTGSDAFGKRAVFGDYDPRGPEGIEMKSHLSEHLSN